MCLTVFNQLYLFTFMFLHHKKTKQYYLFYVLPEHCYNIYPKGKPQCAYRKPVNIMTDDDLATQGARPSASMVLTQFSKDHDIVYTGRVNTLRLRQNGHHFTDNIFKCNFLNENLCISVQISLKFVLQGPLNNKTSLIQIMAWRWTGTQPMMA